MRSRRMTVSGTCPESGMPPGWPGLERSETPGNQATLLAAALLAVVVVAGCPNQQSPRTSSGSTTGESQVGDDLTSQPDSSAAIDSDAGSPADQRAAPAGDPAAGDAHPVSADPTGTREPAAAVNWTSFRNGSDLRGIAGSTLPDNLQLLWELETHDGVTSTAAIAEGRVWVAELSGFVRCLDLRSGEEIWRYRTIENQDPEEFAPGFNAPVTLSDTGVFVGDEEGTLHALDRDSGRPLWKPFDTDGEIKGGVTMLDPDPATGAPRLLFGSHDGNLYCLNAATGEQLWQFDTRGPVNGSQALTQRKSPAPVNGAQPLDGQHTFVSGCDQPVLRVVDIATGAQYAEVSLNDSLLIASPALVGDILYFGTPEGEVVALDWVKQARVWTYSDPSRKQEIHSSPAVTDQLVLIGSRDKRLHAIDRLTGQAVWAFETRGPIDSSPVVVGERIFFGSADRNVYAVDFTGNEVWKHNAGRRISASPAVGAGHLVIGCEGSEGRILCFGAMQ